MILPCLLVIGLVFLLRGIPRVIGVSLIGLSVLLYLGFVFLDATLSPERVGRAEWASIGSWILLCCVAIAAAWVLKPRIRSELDE